MDRSTGVATSGFVDNTNNNRIAIENELATVGVLAFGVVWSFPDKNVANMLDNLILIYSNQREVLEGHDNDITDRSAVLVTRTVTSYFGQDCCLE